MTMANRRFARFFGSHPICQEPESFARGSAIFGWMPLAGPSGSGFLLRWAAGRHSPDCCRSHGPSAWEFPGRLLLRRRLLCGPGLSRAILGRRISQNPRLRNEILL